MASQTRSPGLCQNVTGIGNVNWSGPSNALTSDNTRTASALSAAAPMTRYLYPSTYGFSIPSTATIKGIEVRIERRMVGAASGAIDHTIALQFDATNKATATAWPTSDTVATYGGPTDMWGGVWNTPALINNAAFGPLVVAQRTAGDPSVQIDHVEVTVYYSDLVTGAAAVAGVGSVAGSGTRQAFAAASFVGTGSLAATATRTAKVAASFAGAGFIAGSLTRTANAQAAVEGTGGVNAAGGVTRNAAGGVSGTGSLAATGARATFAAGSVVGVGQIAATARSVITASASVSGTGAIYGFVVGGHRDSTYGGTASMTYDGTASATYDGTADATYDQDESMAYDNEDEWAYEPVTG